MRRFGGFLLAAVLMLTVAGADANVGVFRFGGGGVSGPGPGTPLASRTFINDGVSTQAAGTPTRMFGQMFKDGDVCGSDAPQFVDGSTAQPFSASPANARRYFPSGCLMFASFILRPTFSLGAAATKTITIKNGGAWPSASSRVLTEVYNQNLKVNLPAVSAGIAAANGVLGSNVTLVSALNGDGNQYRTVTWLDGDAGKCWWADTKAAQTIGGAADAEIQVAHYFCALNDGNGNLGGFRWNAEIRAPNYDSSCLPSACVRAFASPNSGTPANGVNWQLGASTPTPMYWTPYAPKNITTAACGHNACTTTANAYWTGAGGPGNIVPGYFSGSTIANYTNNLILYGLSLAGDTASLDFYDGPAHTQTQIGPGGSGTATFNPLPVIMPFTSLFFATRDGEWNFFQSTGSITAETTLRTQLDQTYTQKAGLFPPWDLSLCGDKVTILCPSAGGVITDTTWAYDYTPLSIGATLEDMSNAGDHADIGTVMNTAVLDFYNQSAVSRKAILVNGYAASHLDFDFENGSTHMPPQIYDGSNPYTGLGAYIDIGWAGAAGSTTNRNFTPPSDRLHGLSMGVAISFDHRPNYASWAYATTGEPQFLRLMIRMGMAGELISCCRGAGANSFVPYAFQGVTTAWDVQYRSVAWDSLGVQDMALFYPFDPTHPTNTSFDGTQFGKYANDMADADANYPIDLFNLPGIYGASDAYIKSRGLWTMVLWFAESECPGSAPFNAPPCFQRDGPEWEVAMVGGAMGKAVARGNAKAKLFFKDILAKRWKYDIDTYGGYSLYGYYERMGLSVNSSANQHTSNTMIAADRDWAISAINAFAGAQVHWTNTGSPYWSLNGFLAHVNLHNGMSFIPYVNNGQTECHPANMTINETYHVANLSGSTFDLLDHTNTLFVPSDTTATSALPGCAAYNNFDADYLPTKAASPAFDVPYALSYPWTIGSIADYGLADGNDSLAGGLAQTHTDVRSRLTNGPGGPFFTYSGCGGSCLTGETIDARYATQDHRGP